MGPPSWDLAKGAVGQTPPVNFGDPWQNCPITNGRFKTGHEAVRALPPCFIPGARA